MKETLFLASLKDFTDDHHPRAKYRPANCLRHHFDADSYFTPSACENGTQYQDWHSPRKLSLAFSQD
jgi:hypothetical protein